MEFETLRDLVGSITRNKIKEIEVLGNPNQSNSRVEELYNGIAKGRFTSDEAAALYFCGEKNAKGPNYRKLRNRLVRQLINTALFVDVNQPMFTERAKAFYHCYRDFAAAYILISKDVTKAGIYLLEQVLEQAVKFEFIELGAEITRYLRSQYARSLGDQDKHEHYADLHRMYEEKRRLEMRAFDCFENLASYYIVRRSPNDEVHRYATEYFAELMPLAATVNTYQFYYYTYYIGVAKYLSVNDFQGVLTICNEALDKFEHRKNVGQSGRLAFAIQKISCLTQLRIFTQEGEATTQLCLQLTDEGDFNWFRVMEAYFYYCLYAKRYDDALDIFAKAIQHPRYQLLEGAVHDNWQMYGGYLHLLGLLGKLNAAKVEQATGPFRYAKFFNEFEVLDKDKIGMNIPLVFLPILFSLVKGEFTASIEALEKYRKRYLDNEMNHRSASFMRMLIALAKKPFEAASSEKKIKKELELLSQVHPEVASQTFAVEIIPYEDLWAMLTTPN